MGHVWERGGEGEGGGASTTEVKYGVAVGGGRGGGRDNKGLVILGKGEAVYVKDHVIITLTANSI